MNRTLVFAFVGALGTAFLVALLISASMGKKESGPSAEILVATKDLPIGTKLNGGNTRWQKWPSAASIPGALLKDKVKDDTVWKDQKIRRVLTKDEPITEGALVRDIKGSYLAAALEPGMRAVSVEVDAASGVAGFLSPGDRVDIILTYDVRVRSNNNENAMQQIVVEKASETILENLRVLATDQDAAGNTGDDRKAKISKTITLEVTKSAAEKIALASQMGKIHLAMRQLGDAKQEDTGAIGTTDVGMGRILQQTVTVRNQMEDTANTVRLYSGNSVQQVPVRPTPGDAR